MNKISNDLFNILNKNPQQTIATRGFFMNYVVKDFIIHNDSALLLGQSDNEWTHIISTNSEELKTLLKKWDENHFYFFSVEDWMIPIISKDRVIEWQFKTDRFLFDPTNFVCKKLNNIIKLDASFANHIYEHSNYKDYISIEYIKDRLANDISAGIIIDEQLVAWAFTHDDGALGFLHVIEKYRNKGLATKVFTELIHLRKLEQREIFGNVVKNNQPSLNLLSKLGFTFDRSVSWMKLILKKHY